MAKLSEFKESGLKKDLIRLYGEVNRSVYGYGINELKIHVYPNMIIILTKDKRVEALKSLETHYLQLKQSVDIALFSEFKLQFREAMRKELGLEPVALMRDFDADYQMAVTVVVFEGV